MEISKLLCFKDLSEQLKHKISFSIFVVFPRSIVKRADTSLFKPSSNAVMMESMIANSPRNNALFGWLLILVGLTIDAWLHNVTFANGAVFYFDVPWPESYSSPFFDFESLRNWWFLFHFSISLINFYNLFLSDLNLTKNITTK